MLYDTGWLTVCSQGSWTSPAGGCYKNPQFCYDRPPLPSGNNSRPWQDMPGYYPEGSAITTSCQSGYSGSYQAVCRAGSFSELSGGCYPDVDAGPYTYAQPAGKCIGRPDDALKPTNSNWDSVCTNRYVFVHGDPCRAKCNSGYVGAPVVYCLNGQWIAPPAIPNTCSLASTSLQCPYAAMPPPESFPADSGMIGYGNCYGWSGAAADGGICVLECWSRAMGRPMILCKRGTWIIQGSCTVVSYRDALLVVLSSVIVCLDICMYLNHA